MHNKQVVPAAEAVGQIPACESAAAGTRRSAGP